MIKRVLGRTQKPIVHSRFARAGSSPEKRDGRNLSFRPSCAKKFAGFAGFAGFGAFATPFQAAEYLGAPLFSDGYDWHEDCLIKKCGDDAAGKSKVICKVHRQVVGEDLVVLRVSGQITGDNVKMLRDLLDEESTALTLDLRDVRLVDGDAVRLLAIQEANGVRITNCPLYIREWIKRERDPS